MDRTRLVRVARFAGTGAQTRRQALVLRAAGLVGTAGHMAFEFEKWWAEILARDDAWLRTSRKEGDEKAGPIPLLSCVFCHEPIQASEHGAAMLAWWDAEIDREYVTQACGLYHQGQHKGGRCADAATSLGGKLGQLYLRDGHAEDSIGPYAFDELERIAWTYTRWETTALRRMVLLCGELGRLKSRDPSGQAERRKTLREIRGG